MANGSGAPDLPPRGGRGGGDHLSRGRTPDRLAGIVDAHCHLQHRQFDTDRDGVLERAAAAGIERILVPGWDLPSSVAALELASRHAPTIQAAVGVHPHHAAQMTAASWERIEALAADPACAAVGEIGLDFFRNLSPPGDQRDAFARQLALAVRLDKPIVVHDRDAHAEITTALADWVGRAASDARGVLHAFSGDAEMAAALTSRGFVLSFALPVTFSSNAGPRAAAAASPSHTMTVETDAPYLGPDPRRRNEPATVLRVAAELARLRDVEPQAVARAARATYDRLLAR